MKTGLRQHLRGLLGNAPIAAAASLIMGLTGCVTFHFPDTTASKVDLYDTTRVHHTSIEIDPETGKPFLVANAHIADGHPLRTGFLDNFPSKGEATFHFYSAKEGLLYPSEAGKDAALGFGEIRQELRGYLRELSSEVFGQAVKHEGGSDIRVRDITDPQDYSASEDFGADTESKNSPRVTNTTKIIYVNAETSIEASGIRVIYEYRPLKGLAPSIIEVAIPSLKESIGIFGMKIMDIPSRGGVYQIPWKLFDQFEFLKKYPEFLPENQLKLHPEWLDRSHQLDAMDRVKAARSKNGSKLRIPSTETGPSRAPQYGVTIDSMLNQVPSFARSDGKVEPPSSPPPLKGTHHTTKGPTK